ncbi:MAG: transposase, partial [Pseudomonas sp.]|nr:transposase [Pseudomonas sp.]
MKLSQKALAFYALNRWQALVRYCDDGRIEIDN